MSKYHGFSKVKECPNCGYSKSKVSDVRNITRQYGITRRRQCPKCKMLWTTVELMIDEVEEMRK